MPYTLRINKTRREYALKTSISIPKSQIKKVAGIIGVTKNIAINEDSVDNAGSFDVPERMLPLIEKKIKNIIGEINEIEQKRSIGLHLINYKIDKIKMINMTPEQIKKKVGMDVKENMFFVDINISGMCEFDIN